MSRTLGYDRARAFYDRFGARQDAQGFYEDAPLDRLVAEGRFGTARAVVEMGCGTGRLAERLLQEVLPGDARYLGLDISPVMVRLASARLAPWRGRAEIRLTDGTMRLPTGDGWADRFVSTYVADLLSESDIRALISEAGRVLAPGGLLCLASLTHGRTWPSRAVSRLWSLVHRLAPERVGGCRPIRLSRFVTGPAWMTLHDSTLAPFAIPSEVLIAARAAAPAGA